MWNLKKNITAQIREGWKSNKILKFHQLFMSSKVRFHLSEESVRRIWYLSNAFYVYKHFLGLFLWNLCRHSLFGIWSFATWKSCKLELQWISFLSTSFLIMGALGLILLFARFNKISIAGFRENIRLRCRSARKIENLVIGLNFFYRFHLKNESFFSISGDWIPRSPPLAIPLPFPKE